jgi:hypothetical protein
MRLAVWAPTAAQSVPPPPEARHHPHAEVIACVLGPTFGVGSEMAGDIVAALGEASYIIVQRDN